MNGAPVWDVDGRDWPNRASSRFVRAGGLTWHVQMMGPPLSVAPVALLLHGTGASTHSWRRLAPLLATHFTVIAPDLPGHGFTEMPPSTSMSLPGMARVVTTLVNALDAGPAIIVGHSAGAAIAVRMAIDERVDPLALISINGALMKLEGPSTFLFPAVARMLAMTQIAPRLFAMQASGRGMVERLLAGTGSRIDPVDARLYARLLARPGHVAGALRMMASWDLSSLELERLNVPLTLMVGSNDRMIRPDGSVRAAARSPDARIVTLPGLGHLAHEEDPATVARLIVKAAEMAGVRFDTHAAPTKEPAEQDVA